MIISFVLIKLFYGINIITDGVFLSDYSNPLAIKSLKLTQVLSGELGFFIIPCFVAAYFFENNYLKFLQLNKRAALISFFLVVIILFVSTPLINWMVKINSQLKLPDSF